MALSRKSDAQRAAGKAKYVQETLGRVREDILREIEDSPSAALAVEDALRVDQPRVAGGESADASMLQDIDAILSRLDDGIAREREAMDDLLERIRQPAA